MRMFWSCPSLFISAAQSTVASGATILFAKSSGAVERPSLFQTAASVATSWSSWPVVVIVSWLWARATIRFRSSHMSSFDGLHCQMTKVRLPPGDFKFKPKYPLSGVKRTLRAFEKVCGSSHLQNAIGGRVRQLERIGDSVTGDLAVVHIQAITQMWVIVERPSPSFVGERKDKGCCSVGQSEGRGARYRTWHIRHAIMHNIVDHKGWMRMGGRPRCLGATTLIDSNIHYDRARLHGFDCLRRDQFWRGCARHKHGSNNEVGSPAE